jgi:hypothetical protein
MMTVNCPTAGSGDLNLIRDGNQLRRSSKMETTGWRMAVSNQVFAS